MALVLDTADALRFVTGGVITLIGFGACIAWISGARFDLGGLPARIFVTVGLVATVLDLGGVGSVLGLSLAAMGGLVWWESQPEPEVPRPKLRGIAVAAVVTGLVALATLAGWGPLARIPESVRLIASLGVAGAGVLGTLAVADRARVTFRDAIRRRFDAEPGDVDAGDPGRGDPPTYDAGPLVTS